MGFVDFIGYLAALLSAITFAPQVYQAYQTKSVGDLSWGMLWIVFTSVICWLIYGIVKGLLPVIIANCIVIVLSGVLIYFKFVFTPKK